ncbi:DUF6452 family protein [Flavobacterium sp. MK4S-17]|uniref:DUF6452 family protein n=1 Tax=Flavobacterium sp. MK4S-17 TaxID=2543737 RepID=UPI0013573DAF|nr:DUF6452 family protein [Flavobacterium sp. MK4S-17]
MKRKSAVTLLAVLFTAFIFNGCEKDDICAEGTPTTPSVIVEFYYLDNPSTLRPLTNFRYYALGNEKLLPETDGIPPAVSRIELPLQTDGQTTTWALVSSSPQTGGGYLYNTDFITFNYTTAQLYVSRACGYKSQFFLDNLNPVALTDNTEAGEYNTVMGLWIKDIIVANNTIENEDETHIKIYL